MNNLHWKKIVSLHEKDEKIIVIPSVSEESRPLRIYSNLTGSLTSFGMTVWFELMGLYPTLRLVGVSFMRVLPLPIPAFTKVSTDTEVLVDKSAGKPHPAPITDNDFPVI